MDMSTRRDAANDSSRGPAQPSNTNTPSSHDSNSSGANRPMTPTKPKGVTWAEDQLTFYREGTPPPLDHDGYQQDSLSTGPHAAGAYSYDYSYDHVAPPAPIPQATICGLGKRLFCMIVAAAILVVAIAVGVGVGVGVGTRHDSTSDEHDSSTITTYVSSAGPLRRSVSQSIPLRLMEKKKGSSVYILTTVPYTQSIGPYRHANLDSGQPHADGSAGLSRSEQYQLRSPVG